MDSTGGNLEGVNGNGSHSQDDNPSPPKSASPPAIDVKLASTVTATGPLRLVALQEPQENFHKDEGGKANQLSYRVILQGELPQDLINLAIDGVLPLTVRPIFDDGEMADMSVLDVVAGTESPQPGILLKTRLGGVRYRLRTVSKRLGSRGIAVVVELTNYPQSVCIKSESTMVYSKRKNKEQRLEEQAKERTELQERQRAAQLLLSARASPAPGESANVAPIETNIKFPSGTTSTANLPPPFVQANIVRPRPRRMSRERESDSDGSYESTGNSSAHVTRRKRNKVMVGGTTTSTRLQGRKSMEDRIVELEHEVSTLRSSLESHIRDTEEMRGAMNLCFYQLGGGSGIRRSSSQNVSWDFMDDNNVSLRDQLLGNFNLISPHPTRSPFEMEWMNGGAPGDNALRLRRDISSGSQISSTPRPSHTPLEASFSLLQRDSSNGATNTNSGVTAAKTNAAASSETVALPAAPAVASNLCTNENPATDNAGTKPSEGPTSVAS